MVDWHLVALSHVVVDGSNVATEGRPIPSLDQLDEAVRQFQDEFPDVDAIVVVDATFGHRIDPSERKAFDDAVAHGELVSPPAGAVGRGDAFVLRIAERVGGQVLSNDSFQEFHAEHPWLFDEGRLIGGKPVPGVGWIFTLRTPVRGPRSAPRARQRATLAAVEVAAAQATEAASAVAASAEEQRPPPGPAPGAKRRRRRRRRRGDPEVQAAIEVATEEAIAAPGAAVASATGRRAARTPTAAARRGPEAVNDPLTFLTFIAEHPLGDTVSGTVSNFVSHGAMVDVGEMHCYVPLSGLAVPPPASARAVLGKGETRPFVLVALDPPRRGAQLALPEVSATRRGRSEVPAASARTPKGSDAISPAKKGKVTPAKKAQAAPAKQAETAPAKAAKAAKRDKAAPAKKAQAAPAKQAETAKTARAAKATRTTVAAAAPSPTRAAKAASAKKAKATPPKKAKKKANASPAKTAATGKSAARLAQQTDKGGATPLKKTRGR
jgi:hypothetical protein